MNNKTILKLMENNYDDFSEMAQDARRALERERDKLMERAGMLEAYLRVLDGIDEVLAEKKRLEDKVEDLQHQLDEEKDRNQTLEMRLSELSKLSAGVARKSSQEELLKALRAFVNKSKQKRIEKRTAVKEMVMELAVANGIVFPEDLAATIESLDDEQPDPKVVHVAGNYNDIHDNDRVDMNEKPKKDNGRK